MIGMPSATMAFFFWAQGNSRSIRQEAPIKEVSERSFEKSKWSSNTVQTNAFFSTRGTGAIKGGYTNMDGDDNDFVRTFSTQADKFYHENRRIPLPSIVHATISELSAASTTNQKGSKSGNKINENENQKNIFVIGDVHGCYDELLELHAKAVEENDSMQFQYVIMTGDLCNKGPQSAKVIRHVRSSPGWFSVRGNHDDAGLAAALGDTTRLRKKTYQWASKSAGEEYDPALCDDDVNWLSQLPYTIKIPRDLLGENHDTLIVHAGLIPHCSIEDQKISTMTTIRDLISRCNEDGVFTHFEYHHSGGNADAKVVDAKSTEDGAKFSCNEAVTWASAWSGPERVIFGHDARRKLQLHEGNWATGLDTGAVYGGELTGIILPERKLVSVKSKEYSPIAGKNGNTNKEKTVGRKSNIVSVFSVCFT